MKKIFVSHLLPDAEMKKIIEQTGAGVESIDFSIGENLDHLEETIEQYQQRLEYMGCRQLILHGPFLDLNPMSYDGKLQALTRLRYEQCYEAAKRLGAEKIVFHSCFLPWVYFREEWAERTIAFFQEFLKGKEEIAITVENLYDPDWELLKKLDRGFLGKSLSLCLDIGHAHCYSAYDTRQWLSEMGASITHFHVHDNWKDRDAHLALGEGSIEIQPVLDYIRTNDCTVTIENHSFEDVMKSWKKLQGEKV